MKYAFYLLLSFTIIFTSCSTTKDKRFSDQVSIELVETFDLKDDKFLDEFTDIPEYISIKCDYELSKTHI